MSCQLCLKKIPNIYTPIYLKKIDQAILLKIYATDLFIYVKLYTKTVRNRILETMCMVYYEVRKNTEGISL